MEQPKAQRETWKEMLTNRHPYVQTPKGDDRWYRSWKERLVFRGTKRIIQEEHKLKRNLPTNISLPPSNRSPTRSEIPCSYASIYENRARTSPSPELGSRGTQIHDAGLGPISKVTSQRDPSRGRRLHRTPARTESERTPSPLHGHGLRNQPSPELGSRGTQIHDAGSALISTNGSQRVQSSGRRLHRTPTPFPISVLPSIEIDCSPSSHGRSESRQAISRPETRRPGDGLGRSGGSSDHTGDELILERKRRPHDAYRKTNFIVKGRFLVSAPINSYRFPVKRETGPLWQSGDGFSDDEAVPDFLFYATGHKKRAKQTSLPGFGTLPLLPISDEDSTGIRNSQKRQKVEQAGYVQLATKLCEGAKDPWPTFENFVESKLPARTKKLPIQTRFPAGTHRLNEPYESLRGTAQKPKEIAHVVPSGRKVPLQFPGHTRTHD